MLDPESGDFLAEKPCAGPRPNPTEGQPRRPYPRGGAAIFGATAHMARSSTLSGFIFIWGFLGGNGYIIFYDFEGSFFGDLYPASGQKSRIWREMPGPDKIVIVLVDFSPFLSRQKGPKSGKLDLIFQGSYKRPSQAYNGKVL
jgi:hypothetical protein